MIERSVIWERKAFEELRLAARVKPVVLNVLMMKENIVELIRLES